MQVYNGAKIEVRFFALEVIGRDETARGHLNAILKAFGPRGPTKGDRQGQEDLVPYLKRNLVALITGKLFPTPILINNQNKLNLKQKCTQYTEIFSPKIFLHILFICKQS